MLFPVLNDWFDNDFSDGFMSSALRRANATAPAVNVKEDNEKYTMEVAVPGIKKEYVRVNKLEHKEEEPKKKEHYLRREFSYSNYQQTYTLPDDVDKSRIAARVADGILTITLPKMTKEDEKKSGRAIEIK